MGQSLVSEYPETPTYRRDLAQAFYQRGNALRELDRPEEELSQYRNALPLQNGLVAEFPAVIIGEPPLGSAFGLAPPSRLGGPKPAASPAAEAPNGKSAFLRAAHGAACANFKTVLGPEANKAHRNHFHLDMSPRRSAAICE